MKTSSVTLSHTLDSGQFFRYQLHDGWYYVVTREKVFRIRQEGDELFYEGASDNFIRHFFGFDEDYAAIKKQLKKDAVLADAIKQYPGLRIIKQDPWECTVFFLCSQFSNIKKIKRNLDLIAEKFGKEIIFKGKKFFTFPPPGAINDLKKLKKCSVGFRAKYILAVNNAVSDEFFARLRKLSYIEAKEELMKLPGIGEKVADCILLFSLDFTESFPVDVWMERVMKENYAVTLPLRKMSFFGREKWGKLAGYAQQWLYHWKRLHKNP